LGSTQPAPKAASTAPHLDWYLNSGGYSPVVGDPAKKQLRYREQASKDPLPQQIGNGRLSQIGRERSADGVVLHPVASELCEHKVDPVASRGVYDRCGDRSILAAHNAR
jgi:hypothetical protein